ncbi:alpha/beta fold hydrolase [Bacillus horti]|uniref:alpha/beta fold hydrolase n=1 Tax=Caldalkalibacillus horti TaxID=77523 RepID=UPI0027D7D4E9|nr:alpha/beta hydrolase [Bacillus horti]
MLIHGGGMDSAKLSWDRIIENLSHQAQVYALDLPGYGQSEYRSGVQYSTNFYAHFIKAFMDELKLDKAMVMGLSLGGGVVLSFTLQFPERATALGLVGANGMAKKWEWHFITYHFYVRTPLNRLSLYMMRKKSFIRTIVKAGLFYKPENITDELLDEIYQEALNPHFGRAYESFQRSDYMGRQGLRSYFGDQMPNIDVPTLIIHGSDDRTIPVDHARRAHKLIPDSELHIMDECRHWSQKEYPNEFSQVVGSFISRKLS